jgi:tetratricopeptide (TPR) repeat protein
MYLLGASLLALPIQAQTASPPYETAATYVRQGQFDLAIPLIEQILAATPQNLKARNLLGIALSSVGRKEDANVQLRKALEIDPNFAPALKNLAVNELSLGQYKDAGTHFQQVLRTTPQDPVVHYGLAEVDYVRKDFAHAVKHYEQSGDLYLKDPQATLHYAESAVASKNTATAVAVLDKLGPDADARVQFAAGVLLAQAERYQGAARHFQLASPGYPDPYEVGFNLTLAYQKALDDAHAIETGQQLLAGGYRKAELYNVLSQAYVHANRIKEAYDALRAAIEIEPRDENNYIDLVSLCVTHENYDLGMEISDIGLKAIPDSYRLRLERGVVMAMKGRFEDAEHECELATQSARQASLPYAALALVRMQMNKLPEAIDVLRSRRRRNPNDYLADWFLAEAISRQGAAPGTPQEKEAVRALEDAVRANPNASQPRTLLGKFLAKRGEVDRAADAFERALKLDPDDTTAAYQLAFLCRKKGDLQRANELFAKVSKAKAEDRDQTTRRNLVKIIREGSQ